MPKRSFFSQDKVGVVEAMNLAGLEWDRGNREKCQKHGVSPFEIEQLFRNQPLILPDRTGNAEARFNAVGVGTKRYVFVVFTIRAIHGGRCIRPISARYMHEGGRSL